MNPIEKKQQHKMTAVVVLAGAVLIITGISTPSLAFAKATAFTVSQQFPIDLDIFVACAAGGAGEEVHLTGTLHDLFNITLDSAGGFHLKGQDNPQAVSGTGETTGDKYQATGASKFEFNGKVGFEQTFVNNFHIIGQGNGNNLLVHENIHVTVNADGTVTALHDNFSIECK